MPTAAVSEEDFDGGIAKYGCISQTQVEEMIPTKMPGACRCDEERGIDIWRKMKKKVSAAFRGELDRKLLLPGMLRSQEDGK